MRILVTGGAGCIGGVVVARLREHGHQVEVLDDLSTGYAETVPEGVTPHRMPLRRAEEVLDGDVDAMRRHRIPRLILSSTAAVYGDAGAEPITERTPTRPTNPYGASELASDHMLTAAQRHLGR